MHHVILSCKLIHFAHGDLLHKAFVHSTNIYLTPSTFQVPFKVEQIRKDNSPCGDYILMERR